MIIPFLTVYQGHGLETGAVLDLSWYRLRTLDTALGHIEGNIHTRGNSAGCQANDKLPHKLQGGIL